MLLLSLVNSGQTQGLSFKKTIEIKNSDEEGIVRNQNGSSGKKKKGK